MENATRKIRHSIGKAMDIEKLRRRDNVLQEIAERQRLRQRELDMENVRSQIRHSKNIALIKKVFVDLYQPEYKQQEML